ncbi:MAG: hypothetical protein ACT4TC_20005 [Myxococcaceae bacterium]
MSAHEGSHGFRNGFFCVVPEKLVLQLAKDGLIEVDNEGGLALRRGRRIARGKGGVRVNPEKARFERFAFESLRQLRLRVVLSKDRNPHSKLAQLRKR